MISGSVKTSRSSRLWVENSDTTAPPGTGDQCRSPGRDRALVAGFQHHLVPYRVMLGAGRRHTGWAAGPSRQRRRPVLRAASTSDIVSIGFPPLARGRGTGPPGSRAAASHHPVLSICSLDERMVATSPQSHQPGTGAADGHRSPRSPLRPALDDHWLNG